MLRNYRVVSAAIIVFWLVMIALLLDREVFVKRAAPGAGGPAEYDSWMGIFTAAPDGSENQVGYVHSVLERGARDEAPGATYSVEFELATTLLSVPTQLRMEGAAWVPDGEGLSTFDVTFTSSGDHRMAASGVVEDGKMVIDVQTGGDRFPVELPVGRDVLLSGNFGATTLNLPALEVGDQVFIDAFDPVTLSSGVARIKCIGVETLDIAGEKVFTKVLTTSSAGITTKTWVTNDEEVVRVETPFGIILRKIPAQDSAAYASRDLDPGELLDTVAIRPAGLTPFRGARRMLVRLSGHPPDAPPPSDSTQRHVGGGVYLIEKQEPGTDVTELPSTERYAEYLTGDALVQVDHPVIAAHAADVAGDAGTPWDQALRLHHWLYENIEKAIVLSFPSALDVLESRQGDCNEHTVLFAALARSLDIPTRIAIGIVWSEELHGFYYHAWPEVYIGGWTPMDPTLDQETADATHIKLLNGNIEAWPQLLAYLGQLQVEVLEIE